MKKLLNQLLAFAAIAILATQVISCKDDDEPDGDVIASFTATVDEDDYKTFHFANFSKNFTSLSWNFGDASAASTEEDPSHTYAAAGTYTVVLTATGSGGTDQFERDVVVADPATLLTALAGETSKTWKLLRDVSDTKYPLLVGRLDNTTLLPVEQWWGLGRDNDDIAKRACIMEHEYTFNRSGLTFERDLHGMMWGEGRGSKGRFPDAVLDKCFDTTDPNNMKDFESGASLSVWGNFEGTFELTAGTPNTLKINGLGAYIGLEKVGTDAEVIAPQANVTYQVISLYDGTTDTLVLRTHYMSDETTHAYWQFTLVHYDNPADEPPIPGDKPVTAFTSSVAGNVLTLTNTTTGATSWAWDFGDGTSSTLETPAKTFANDGIYTVKLTATNANGSSSARTLVIANSTSPALTDALLQGAAWKVQPKDLSLFVGPAMGSYEWYVVPEADLLGTWACLANDEFKFSAGNVFGYDTKGDVRNDGYMPPFANGCITDAELATVTNDGAKLKTEANHSYTFVPAGGTDRAIITVANAGGASTASAFLGFYKPFYGGENGTAANPINGGATTIRYEVMAYAKNSSKEYLFVTCDISADKNGSASWSFILVR